MMERERLTRLLETPGQVARGDLADLRSLTERFPWFSGAQVLRASGEQAAGDVASDETLRAAAAHVPSRAVLYDLLGVSSTTPPATKALPDPKPLLSVVPEGPPSGEHVALPAPIPLRKSGELVAPIATEAALSPSKPEHTPAVEVEAVDEVAGVEEVEGVEEVMGVAGVDEIRGVEEAEVAPSVKEPLPSIDPLDQQILEAALASAYDLTLHAPPASVVAPSVVLEPASISTEQVAPPSNDRGGSEELRTEPQSVSSEVQPANIPSPQVARTARKRFSSWLVSDASIPTIKSHVEGPNPQVRSTTQQEDEAAPSTPKQVLPPADTMAIVDRFIQQETPLPATKTAFFTPQQAAKRSLDDSAGLVTETLARIYAQQGNVAKAKATYEKLALKYPDKSAYFAALSQALDAQQNK
jgi:hypothetical protein